MELIVKAAVIAVTAAILTLLIKKTNPELSAGLALAACCLILTMAKQGSKHGRGGGTGKCSGKMERGGLLVSL